MADPILVKDDSGQQRRAWKHPACRFCGNPFTSKSRRRKFCSKVCYQADYYERNQAATPKTGARQEPV
jgi:hypothetical protein